MLLLRAKYLLTKPDTVIDNGAVLIDDGKIKFAGRFTDVDKPESYEIIDLGNSAIVPGLVNAHTHLELTSLHNCISYNGDFTDWIRQIIIAKEPWTEHEYVSSIREGITRSLEAGTTTIADINRNGLALDELRKSKIKKILFYELIDFNPYSAESTADNYMGEINSVNKDRLLSIGIFPHAPYTVSKELYRRCKVLSEELGIHIATHISETNDEIEFLTRGTGRFMSLLKDRDMLDNWSHPGLRPIAYLSNMRILKDGWILVHCNYINEEEIDDIRMSGSSVVYCPRSHKYFGHKNHPFRKLINCGINVALGTDSLASNESLSILDEMKYLYEKHKDVRPQNILYMGTVAGAIAFRMENKIGRLESGFDADITVIKISQETASNIYDEIFSQDSVCMFTVVSGSVCYDKYGLSKE
jgi:aminodeoxyfutalosine deaminase